MTIKDILAALENGILRTDDERKKLSPVIALFSPGSFQTINEFQSTWDFRGRPYSEFVKAQDKVLLACLQLELSETGTAIRKQFELEGSEGSEDCRVMTIKDILAALENGTLRIDDERKTIALFSPVSLQTIKEFESSWDSGRPFSEFVKSRNKELLTCLQLELSEFGAIVRQQFGLVPLSEGLTLA